VRAEKFAAVFVEDRLDQAFGFAEGDGLAIRGEGKSADGHVESLLFGPGFGQPD